MHQPIKKLLTGLLIVTLILSCSSKHTSLKSKNEQFTKELSELKEYFNIPGLAVSVDKNGQSLYREYFGVSDVEKSIALDSTTVFPIASITKVFSGVLIMKLIEQKKLSLEDPIKKFIPNTVNGDSILVKHLLSHTSQGDLGEKFYYSSRFGWLTKVIETASERSFKELMEEEIIKPVQLRNTFLLKDTTQISKVAKPYILDNGLKNGFIDYGYSSSAGIVSNLDDLSLFNEALDSNTMISKESKDLMFSSFNKLPYGYGVFHQTFEGIDMVWAYGQYDCYSSLLLKIPSKNITLTLLANNNLLSDPARLINGDITASLFALSFLKNYVVDISSMQLFETTDSLSKQTSNDNFYRKKLLARALAESYMARFDSSKLKTSAKIVQQVFTEYPNILEYADINLLHTLTFLKDVSFYRNLGEFNDFDTQIETIGSELLVKDPNNPYLHIYLGTFYARKKEKTKAKYHFQTIINAKNFSQNWYTKEAEQGLKELK